MDGEASPPAFQVHQDYKLAVWARPQLGALKALLPRRPHETQIRELRPRRGLISCCGPEPPGWEGSREDYLRLQNGWGRAPPAFLPQEKRSPERGIFIGLSAGWRDLCTLRGTPHQQLMPIRFLAGRDLEVA